MHMNFHLAFEKEGVPEDQRETVFRYGEGDREESSHDHVPALLLCCALYIDILRCTREEIRLAHVWILGVLPHRRRAVSTGSMHSTAFSARFSGWTTGVRL